MAALVARSIYVVSHLYSLRGLEVYRASYHPSRLAWRRIVREGAFGEIVLSEEWLERNRSLLGDDGLKLDRPTIIQQVCVSSRHAELLTRWFGTAEGPAMFGGCIVLPPAVSGDLCSRMATAIALQWADPSLSTPGERAATLPVPKI